VIRPAEARDLGAVYELLAARDRAAFGIAEVQLRHLRADWGVPSFVVGEDNWVAESEGAIVGYAALDSAHELVLAATDPHVGDELLHRAEQRARTLGLESIVAIVLPEDEPLRRLALRHGFALDRSIWRMWRPLDGDVPEAALPDDVRLRTYSDADGEAVHALLDLTYAGWDPDHVPRPHADWLSWMTGHDDFDPALWFLAGRGEQLVGAALHWREHQGAGWVKDVVVVESERGRGLGKALLQEGFREYAQRGANRVGLKVDSTNPTGAPQLYSRLGFVTDRIYEIRTRPL